jgi:hypothetical protein
MYRVIQSLGRGRESTIGIFSTLTAARREADRILAVEPLAVVYVTR